VLRQHTVTDALVLPDDPATPVGRTPQAQGKSWPSMSVGGTAIGPAPAPPTPGPINAPRAPSPAPPLAAKAQRGKRPSAAFVSPPGAGAVGLVPGGSARAIDPTVPVASDGGGGTEDASAAALGSQPGQITAALLNPEQDKRRLARRPDRAEDLVGKVLGSYKVQKVIGKGGMGRVYRAEHVKLGRQVALKLLKPEYAVKRDAVARFFGEAKAVNKIRHRNIVDITDFVEADDGTTFIIMELLEGHSLGRILRDGGPMAEARALSVLAQVGDALAAAHAVGIIHRDLKPDNVFVCPDDLGGEVAKLLDFGVAKLLIAEGSTSELGWQTAAGSVVGTPTYMSPEQAGGLEIDGRSDVYSLGAIMYEIFTGQPPFKARSFGEFVLKHINEPPVPPRRTPGGADMRPTLEAICLKCLAKRPDERFSSAAELRDALIAELEGGIESLPGRGRRRPLAALSPPGAAIPGAAAQNLAAGTPPADSASNPLVVAPLAGGLGSASVTDQAGEITESAGPGPRRGGRHPLGLMWAFVGAAVLAAVVAWAMTTTSKSKVAPAAPAVLPPPVAPAAPVEPQHALTPPPARERKVTVRSIPTAAEVYALGALEPLCKTPCEIVLDLDDSRSGHFKLELTGYVSRTLDVDLTDDANPPTVSLIKDPGAEPALEPGGSAGKSPGAGKKPSKPAEPATRPAEPATRPAEPGTEPATAPPSGGPIDPSKTLNPFGHGTAE
jgi:serine/threonine-protein kinase